MHVLSNSAVRGLSRAPLRVVASRRSPVASRRKPAAKGDGSHEKEHRQQQQQQQQQQQAADTRKAAVTPWARLRRTAATGAAAAAAASAAALAGLLPGALRAAAADALDAFSPFELDPSEVALAAGGGLPGTEGDLELLDVMLAVVACYVGLVVLYLWLASILEDEADPNSGLDNSQQQQQQQQQQPGFGSPFASSQQQQRSVRHELVAPAPPSEDAPEGRMAAVKAALAGQAADYVASQIRECASVVRRKLYLRRLAAKEGGKAHAPAAAHAAKAGGEPAVALALGQPGQLELLVDACLDNMPPELVTAEGGDEGVVRGVTGVVARRLAAAEAGELLRSMAAAARDGGGARKDGGAFGAEVW